MINNTTQKRRKRIAAEQSLYNLQQGKIQKPDVYGTKRRKRLLAGNAAEESDQQEANELYPFDDEFDNNLIDSDTIATAELLIKSNPRSALPICFVHQIYSILPNNTIVDRELQEAIKENKWRKFHIIGSLEDEFVIMKTTNYLNTIDQAKIECIKDNDGDIKVFDIFQSVISNALYNNISIKKELLTKEFGLTEKSLAQLVSYGFLLPHSKQLDVYWFSVRKQGSWMSNLSGGRIELQRIIKKRNTKDIMEKLLKQKKLHKTNFNFDFLLHDLVGSGRVERCPTTMGNLIRLTNKGEKGI